MFTVEKAVAFYLSTFYQLGPVKRNPNVFLYFEGYEEVLNIYYSKWQREYREYVRGDLIRIGMSMELGKRDAHILIDLWVSAFSMYKMRLLSSFSIFFY